MHRKLIYLFIMALVAACQETPTNESADRKNGYEPTLKTKEDSVYHDVMEGHDVGMAKTGKLIGALAQVEILLDSLEKLPAKQKNTPYKAILTSIREDLSYADYSMNNWMKEFKVDSLKDNKDARLKYLLNERQKVTLVKERILSSLQRADSLFNKQTTP